MFLFLSRQTDSSSTSPSEWKYCPLLDKTTKSLVAAQLSGKASSSHRNTNYQNPKHKCVCVSVCASSARSVSKSGFDYGSDLVQEHQFVKMYLGSKILSLQKVSVKLRCLIFGICNCGDENHSSVISFFLVSE